MNQLTTERPTISTTRLVAEVRDLEVTFAQQTVLRDISIGVQQGQTLAIIGESGCGKSVLMKTMIGLIRPTHGHAYFDGDDLSKLSERELTQHRIRFGFVFQQAALFDSLTIGQNVSFPLRQHTDLPAAEIRDRVRDLLAQVGLPDSVVRKKPAEISGGMQKRVGLARALAMDPELILYDEPTTGLDPIMSDVINELIMRTSQRGDASSVIVTHDMTSARKVADRIIMLHPYVRLAAGESQIIFDGTPTELDQCPDRRVQQFIRGEAGERLMELRREAAAARS